MQTIKGNYINLVLSMVLRRLYQRRIQDCCNIQGKALCDNSQLLSAVNYYHKVLHVGYGSSPRLASALRSTLNAIFVPQLSSSNCLFYIILCFIRVNICSYIESKPSGMKRLIYLPAKSNAQNIRGTISLRFFFQRKLFPSHHVLCIMRIHLERSLSHNQAIMGLTPL